MATETELTAEKETLFITLSARALDYRARRSILHDKEADDIAKAVNLNITKYKGFGNILVLVRAKQFDEWIKEFIERNKDAAVVYAGCGLDTRVTRIKPPPGVTWFDVDYPEVISLRKSFFADDANYKMIASSVTDDAWLKQIPQDRPTIIVAEGLLEYLAADDVKFFLNRLTNYFSHGEIIFDVMSSIAIKSGEKKLKELTGAVHKWAVDDTSEIDRMDLKLKRKVDIALLKSRYLKKLPPAFWLIFTLLSFSSKYRNIMRLMRYQFQ